MISLPKTGEYNPFYQTYISQLEGHNVLERINEQKAEMTALFNSISEEKSNTAYAEGKWTIKEVLNHINDVERIFTYRALAIARGDKQSLPGMDQDSYQAAATNPSRPLTSYLAEFEAIRSASILFFENLREDETMKEGTASGNKVTVRALAAMTVGHAAHHIQIIKERYL
ncbi:DinB family protein [Roseivirga sp.]|uniref:DinB family protein n=1 Tax=Roseivirga sp. TaxID=1964215 RepID=UPI002B276E75|nr:DinB family protein [Roseivirga sp.]